MRVDTDDFARPCRCGKTHQTDVKEIFIDSTLKAVDVQDLECFIKNLDKLAAFAETKITLSVSMDESELPAGVKDIVTCI